MLDISRLINVQTKISIGGALGRLFNQALAIGDSNVISGLERVRNYVGGNILQDVTSDFGANAPETKACTLYMSQSPKPTSFAAGRWLRTASEAQLQGALLSSSQQAIANFNEITSGGFDVTIDGTAQDITGLNFSQAANLNAVAAIVQAALSGGATCIWNGTEFIITSGTTGAGVEASGTITFTANPSPSDTITVNGLLLTFVSAITGSNQVLIGGSADITATNLWTFLRNSNNSGVTQATYSVSLNVVTATYYEPGVIGNGFTLVASSAGITLSGATLSGGANASSVSYATAPALGQDISSLMGWTAALALPLVPGYDPETPLASVQACDAVSLNWYGLGFAASVMPEDSDYLEVAGFIEADIITRMFAVTTAESGTLTSLESSDIGAELTALNYAQSCAFYSSTNPYAAFAMFGNLLTINLSGSNTFKTMMYQQMVGVVAEDLTDEEANALQAKRYNVFAAYDNSTSILQYGTMAGPYFIDEIYGANAFAGAIQTAGYNVMYTAGTKVPQTDQGDQQFANAYSQVCQQFVTSGYLAPGQWNAPGFGSLQQGQQLKLGYYIYMQPLAQQSEEDRAARETPLFQIAGKLAGANQTGQVLITVNP